MAVSTLRLSVEEKNYWKFCMLNVVVVPDALRNYFNGLLPPKSLSTIVTQNSVTITNLASRRVITAVQLNVLQRIPGTIWPSRSAPVTTGPTATCSADFDVSLLICLLRNIRLPSISPPATGWDSLPIANDTTPGAYLARIKYYRNELAHGTESNMNTLDFQDKWNTVSEAIKFCNGGNSPNEIKKIIYLDMDGSINGAIVASLSTEIEEIKRNLTSIENEKTKMENELKRTEFQLENVRSDFFYYKDGHLPKYISDNIQDLINTWKIDGNPFFVTRAVKLVYDQLESENIVMIIGHSGSGKSAAAQRAALRWYSFGYNVVPVESVEQILEYRRKETRQIFVIDDVLGKYSVDESYLNQWERLDSKLKTLFMDKSAKLICTLRKVLAVNTKFKTTNTILSDNAYIIDIDHDANCLLLEEKMSILKNHLICNDKQYDISKEECTECCKAKFAFPLLCRVFTTSDGLFQLKSIFFQKPFNYLNDEISQLHQRNKEVYCSLVICMIFSRKFHSNMFSVSDSSYEEQSGRILNMVSEACGLIRNISRQTLLDSLLSVEGVYIKNISGKITFLHDSFLEAISFHFSKVNLYVFLECVDSQFLMERVRAISPQVNDDQNLIVLQEESFFLLANRYIVELKKGEFIYVLSSQPIKEKMFVQEMGKLIDSGHYVSKKTIMKTKISSAAVWKWKRFDPIYRQEGNMEAVAVLFENFPEDKTLFHWVIATGCHYFFEYFWNNVSKKEQERCLHRDKSLFSLALLSGCTEIIETMLKCGADVNSLESRYALQRIVVNDRDTKLLTFLINNGTVMSFVDCNRKTPLFYAIASKNVKIHTFLVKTDSKQNPLHDAVYNSNIAKTEQLLNFNNINLVSNNGWSVFHFAAYNNDIKMMEFIFETTKLKCNDLLSAIEKRDKIGWSPLHLAYTLCNYKAVDFLIYKGSKDDITDLELKASLHFPNNEQLSDSILQNDNCSHNFTCKQYTKNKRLSTVLQHQPMEKTM